MLNYGNKYAQISAVLSARQACVARRPHAMVAPQVMGFSADDRTTFEPLVQLLEQELSVAGIRHSRPSGSSLTDFTRYYLAVVQLLEGHVAGGNNQMPMSRAEVEMMCRGALSAANLGEAIALCQRFCAMLYPRAGQLDLQVRGDVATFYLNSLRKETTTATSLVDITGLFAFRQLFQWLVGVDLPLHQVGIGSIQREDVLAFLTLFRAPVLMGGKHCTLEFGRSALALPVVRTREEFPAFFEVFPCGVFAITANALPEQVAALLVASARQGDGIPTQRQIAASLEIPFSTFRRRLAVAGVTFRQLRDDCLRDVAQELLQRGDRTIQDITVHLGFSDPRTFRRAFLRWTGVSPRNWRRQALPRSG